jgi:Skp family chaperone for outer membrane proteins
MNRHSIISRAVQAMSPVALAAVLCISVASPSMAQGKPNNAAMMPGAGLSAPKILVLDRRALLQASKVGQDMARQVQALSKTAEAQLRGESESLAKEKQSLEQQIAILSPEVKQEKIRAFQAKVAAFQQRGQDKQNQIRYGVMLAQQQVEKAVGPIVQQLMQERGAALLIDRQSIVVGAPGLDLTPVAIQRLDQKLSSVKVQMVTPPAELLKRMQPAAQ